MSRMANGRKSPVARFVSYPAAEDVMIRVRGFAAQVPGAGVRKVGHARHRVGLRSEAFITVSHGRMALDRFQPATRMRQYNAL